MSPQFFIRRPRFAFVISILITLLGGLALLVMPVDQYPEISAPKIMVHASYPGASAETVKATVAMPIEDQVNGVKGMIYMSSKSASDGSYTLTITFSIGTDAALAQIHVQNRVTLAERVLPEEVQKQGVVVRKHSPDIFMVVNLFSPEARFDSVYLSNYANLNIEGELARVPGVGEASILGPLDYGMRVWLDPVKLHDRQVSVPQVLAAIREQNLQAAVGSLGAPPNAPDTRFQYVLKTKGRLASADEFGEIILRAEEQEPILYLRDVARLEMGAQAYKGFGEINNSPGILLAVYKQPDANALETSTRVRDKMAELNRYFPTGLAYSIGHDSTRFITASLHETMSTLLLAIALVILVTYFFLGNLRATLIPALAVPVSVIGALAVLHLLGMTINTVTLFALILSIGLVVDDAIIVVEKVERIMREQGLSPRAATEQAMREVAGPIFATSMVLVAVFGPAMLLPGITGEMFAQFGATLIIAILISLVNAMTLSPALCALILRPGEPMPNAVIRGFHKLFERITDGYVSVVGWLARRLVASSLIIAGLFISLLVLFLWVPGSFLPDEDKGFFMVDVQLPEAASLNRTADFMDQLYAELQADPAIDEVLAVNGFSVLDNALQSNAGMIIVRLKHWDERKDASMHQFALQKKYQQRFNQMEGGHTLVFSAPVIPGMGAVAGFSFVLEDTQSQGEKKLFKMTRQMVQLARQRAEVSSAFSTFRIDHPQIWLQIDRAKAKSKGVSIHDIFLTLQTQLGSFYVNNFEFHGGGFKVVVQADGPFRQREQDLNSLYVNNDKGESIALSTLVKTEPIEGANVLYRYNAYDAAIINGVHNSAGGFSSGDAMNAVARMANQFLLTGYKFDWTGSSYEERKSDSMATLALALSLLFTFLLLAALYESFLTPLAIILSVPIAMIGALVALKLTGQPLSLYGKIGIVLLVGMASKTAILVVEFGKALREQKKMDLLDATIEAARLRFRPMVMTGLAFVVGVFPLTFASGAGAASRVSLGLAVFGGAIMALLVGTLLVPIFFRFVQEFREVVHGGPTQPPE